MHAYNTISQALFARALQILPGGVDSPVRAFKAVGGSPSLHPPRLRLPYQGRRRQHLHRLRDVVGAVDSRPRAARARQGARGRRARRHELRRAQSPRNRAWRTRHEAHALDRARALRQLGHGSDDERHPRGAGGDRARADREVRRLLSRTCRSVSGEGGLGGADARRADQPRRHARRRRGHAGGRLQRPGVGRASVRRPSRPDRRGHRGADRRQHGRRSARGWFSARASRRCARPKSRS